MVNESQKYRLEQAANEYGKEYKSPGHLIAESMGEVQNAPHAPNRSRRATLTPNSPQVFALRHIVSVLLVRQFECAASSGAPAEGERCALLRASLSGIDGVSVVDGESDGRNEELRRQIAAAIEDIFAPLTENAAGIDAMLDRAKTGATVE